MDKAFLQLLLLLSIVYRLPSALAKEREPKFEAAVGNFKIPFNDNRVIDKVRSTEDNLTQFDCLYDHTIQYWMLNETPQPDEAEQLRQLAVNCSVKPECHDALLQRAGDGLKQELRNYNNDPIALWNDTFTD